MAEKRPQAPYAPESVSAPGETLEELLAERGISQSELAERTGRPRKTINEIIHGKAAITPETALQLELVLGVPASFWNARESRFRESIARKEEEARFSDHVEWSRQFPVREMQKKRFIPESRDPGERVKALLEFFGVASPVQWAAVQEKQAVAYRKSTAFDADTAALAAWLRMGERIGERRSCSDFAEERFRQCLAEARALTRQPPEVFQPQLVELCERAGVVVAFTPQIKGCRAHGATRWLSPRRALVQLSLRYRTEDHLWFTFFHEAGHILLHRKKAIFLEEKRVNGSKEEAEADRFAADFLIPPDGFQEIRSWTTFTKAAIKRFAKSAGVSSGIVVGRLQHEKLIPYNRFNDLKMRLEWGDTAA